MPSSALPPHDPYRSRLPVEIVEPGTILYRSHRFDLDPVYFSRGHPHNRFDDPEGGFAVCYCARTPEGAFAETFLRQRSGGIVALGELEIRSRAEIMVMTQLRLTPCYGAGLAKLGITAAVTAGPVADAQRWASMIYRHPDMADGILYRVRHDNDQMGVALFDRSKPAVQWTRSELWRHTDLDSICERYALALL